MCCFLEKLFALGGEGKRPFDVPSLNKTTSMTNACQQLFALFNINLTIFFQIDLSIGQNDEYFCVKTTSSVI